jgi:hypothetical protein
MIVRVSAAVALVAASFMLVACGVPAASKPVSEKDYPKQMVAAETALIDRCCKRVGSPGVADDYASKDLQFYANVAPSPDAGAVYDPEAAGRCIVSYEKADCTPTKDHGQALPGCAAIYKRGRFALGHECRSYNDCSEQGLPAGDHAECRPSMMHADGTYSRACTRIRYVGEGEACNQTAADGVFTDCEDPTLLCDEHSHLCTPYAKRGAVCMTGAVWGDTCEIGSVCDRTDTKTCLAPLPVGAKCGGPNTLCEGYFCYDGTCREPLFQATGNQCKP